MQLNYAKYTSVSVKATTAETSGEPPVTTGPDSLNEHGGYQLRPATHAIDLLTRLQRPGWPWARLSAATNTPLLGPAKALLRDHSK